MPAHPSDLLLTKLNRPPVPSDWVDRPRLIEQLNHSLQQGPLTLVCASAGFGKTTLVSAWLESLTTSERPPMPAAWLSLDDSDSDLDRMTLGPIDFISRRVRRKSFTNVEMIR